jgi:hypothetical protein
VNTLARIVRAREALEDGDGDFAAQILADLEYELGGLRNPLRSFPCPQCGLGFPWPGDLDTHMRFVHFDEPVGSDDDPGDDDPDAAWVNEILQAGREQDTDAIAEAA